MFDVTILKPDFHLSLKVDCVKQSQVITKLVNERLIEYPVPLTTRIYVNGVPAPRYALGQPCTTRTANVSAKKNKYVWDNKR